MESNSSSRHQRKGKAESTTASRRRYACRCKQARPAGGPDLISGLDDDVLLRILELLPDAVYAARTHALSRRWRGLWTRVPSLRFVSRSHREFRKSGGPERFADFVDAALALRTAQLEPAAATLDRLEISFTPLNYTPADPYLAPPCIAATRGWMRHAALHTVKSLDLELHLPKTKGPLIDLDDDELRPCGGFARVRLPSTAVFASLTDLSLESINFTTGLNLLARFLSSACCPRLRKPCLSNLTLPKPGQLLLQNDTLCELSCEDKKVVFDDINNPCNLKLRTPSLRVLRVGNCSGEIGDLSISAPRLEELTFRGDYPNRIVSDGELPRVGSLKVVLSTHGCVDDDELEDDMNHVAISLLHYCTSVKHLDVSLDVTENTYQVVDAISGRIPRRPSVTSLTVHVSPLGRLHYFGAGVADLLTQCSSNLRYLCLHIQNDACYIKQNKSEVDFLCDHLNPWKSHGISLLQLEEVELRGLTGTNCELWFMQSVLSNAVKLQKVAVSFNPAYRLQDKRNATELMPQLGSGKWTPCYDANFSYQWMP